jgi:glyoxylate/hydroxypyruvate reductase A
LFDQQAEAYDRFWPTYPDLVIDELLPGVDHLVLAAPATADDGRVSMASLDVCETEPLPAGHWLHDHPKVWLSPHISWSSPALASRIVELLVDNVRRYVAGEPLEGIVDPVERY